VEDGLIVVKQMVTIIKKLPVKMFLQWVQIHKYR